MLKAGQQFVQYLYRCYGDRSTPKHYLNDLDLFIRQIGDKLPEQVTVVDIDNFIDNQMKNQLKPATANRRLAEQRMPMESIRQLPGHAQIQTTQLYTAGVNPDLRDEFLAAMNRIEAAIVHIEGIAATAWPQISQDEPEFVNCSTDSV